MSFGSARRLDGSDVIWAFSIAILAIGLFYISTPWGIGIRPDSAFYLRFPFYVQGNSPAYVWAIQFVSSSGLNDIAAATFLNMLFLSLNVMFVYVLVRGVGASRLIAAVAGLLILTSPLVFELHVTILSEGMFVFLLLATLALLSAYAGSGALSVLLAAGLVSVLLFLTRFNGAPVWVVGVLTVLLLGPGGAKTRLTHMVAFLAVIAAPLILWARLEAETGGSGLGREFALYGNPTLATLMQGANSIWVSFFPSVVPDVVKVVASIGLIGLLVAILWTQTRNLAFGAGQKADTRLAAFPLIAVVYIFGHYALLLVSLIVEANLPLKPSYFAPVYVLLVIVGAQYTALLKGDGNRGVFGVLLLGFGALVLASNVVRIGSQIAEYRSDGIFFAGPSWYQSPLIAEIDKLEPEVIVYSNAPDLVYLLTGQNTNWLPMKFNRRTGEEFPDRPYKMLMDEMRHDLQQDKAVLAFFDEVTWRFYLPTQEELTRDLKLTELVRTSDGTLLHLRSSQPDS